MSETPQVPDDFEPTIRIERDAEDTKTRKMPPQSDASSSKSAAGHGGATGFFSHITGIFRRRNGVFEPATSSGSGHAEHVTLDSSESAAFPPLENAYRRAEEIGAGGQARLFRGFDMHLHRQVAVKSLRSEQGREPALRDKFVSEAMITAQLDHPAIVPVYGIHRDGDGNLHLAMKLINGRSFQSYLAELTRHYERDGFSAGEERRSLDYRLEVFLSICDALEYAHNRNIMHCDLKPENIMIGEYHEAYLMDWGLARRIDDPAIDPEVWKSPSVITGTPRFLSPEAVRGQYCDKRSDIYAMGLILYEIVTLRPAYDGGDGKAVIERIRRGEMHPVTHRFGYYIPADLRKIILKAAAWDREKRYKSVEEFSGDVRKFIRGEEVSANPDGFFGRLARWGYRHRRAMLSLSLGLIALGAVAVSFSFYDRIVSDKREAARTAFSHDRERVLTRALGEAIGVGRALDRQISNIGFGLFSVATEAMLMLNADIEVSSDRPIWFSDQLDKRRPDTLSFAPGFGYEIDMENAFVHIAPGSSPKDWKSRFRRIRMIRPRMLRAVIESDVDAVISRDNVEKLKERARVSGVPLTSIYIGFDDGLFVTYPGEKQSPAYDHLKRMWYVERAENLGADGSLRWRSPYLSANGEMVFSCTMPMIDTRGKFHGVAGADVSLPRMVAALSGAGNAGEALLAKSLVDADGCVIVDTGEKFMADSRQNDTVVNGHARHVRYADEGVFDWIRKHRTGFTIRNENGKSVVYVFSRLYTVEWFYIEKLDLEKLLSKYGVAAPAGMNVRE